MDHPSLGPLEFFEQLRTLVHQHRDQAEARLVLNRPAVMLLCHAMGDGTTTGAAQLPAIVLLGQAGHIGYVEGCAVHYDPKLDRDRDPVARFVARSSTRGDAS